MASVLIVVYFGNGIKHNIYILVFKDKNHKAISMLMFAVFVSNTLVFFPIYYEIFNNNTGFSHLCAKRDPVRHGE